MIPAQVSVVIPAYNAARHLAATLDSVLAQRGPALELLVVDDCSTDGTARLVAARAQRDDRVRYLCTPANCGGPAGPRNLGIANARASWIALCDADDLWHPQKLQRQLATAERDRADLVCTAVRDLDGDATPTAIGLPAEVPPAERVTLGQLLMKNQIATSSVLVRRDLVESAGGFDVDRALIAVEDYDLWLRLLERGDRLLRLPEPLVHYRRVPSSLSARKLQMARKVLRVLSLHFERTGRRWLFPLAAPCLLATYAGYSIVLRVWRGRM